MLNNEKRPQVSMIKPYKFNHPDLELEVNSGPSPLLVVFEAMTDGVMVINKNGLIRFVNTSLLKQLDRTGENVTGIHISENLFGRETETIIAKINQALSHNPQASSVEYHPEKKGKRQTCYQFNISPICFDSNRFAGAVIISRDITEVKKSMTHLNKNQERFRNILDSVEEGYFELDLTGRSLFANDWILRFFGQTKKEMNNISYRDYLTPDSAEEMFTIFNDIYKTGKPAQKVEGEVRTASGEHRFLEVSASLTRDDEGKASGFRGVCRDITDRKMADQALKESEEKYRTILTTIDDSYYEIDTDGNLKFFNDSLCELLQYSPEELVSLNVKDITSEENYREIVPILKDIWERGTPARLSDHLLVRKDGSLLSVETSVSPIRNGLGQITGFRGIVRDITERKIAEEERKSLEAQLIYAQRMESIGTLASGIAHNFNNLLMGIQGNASLMILETGEDHPHFKMLKNIERQVQSGSKLTAQLLGYARKGRYEIKPVNLNQLLKETADTFRDARKEIRVCYDFEPNLAGIDADHGQIEQVLLNLFVNAADAMPTGGALQLMTRNVTANDIDGKPYRPKQGNYVMLQVKDTGIGMDKSIQGRIFEPFFTTKGMAKGTGLGLASAYGIVKAHGGYIEVESEKGQGASFKIYFPASRKALLETKIITDDLLAGDETILLVDDEEIIIEAGEMMLATLGYNVLVARGGKEALEIFKKNHQMIDLVLLDMIMPDMAGGEVYDHLKSINPGVKVLLSSGYSINGQASDILDRGCDSFIQKPFNLMQLSQKMREVLGAN